MNTVYEHRGEGMNTVYEHRSAWTYDERAGTLSFGNCIIKLQTLTSPTAILDVLKHVAKQEASDYIVASLIRDLLGGDA